MRKKSLGTGLRPDDLANKKNVRATNSNTRLSVGHVGVPKRESLATPLSITSKNSNAKVWVNTLGEDDPTNLLRSPGNRGMNSNRMREAMIHRLAHQGIQDVDVLRAMSLVQRHLFVDEALSSRAYEDSSLPIGYGQTISQPWVVAHMISLAKQGRSLGRVLEVGSGCGYQAAVLSLLCSEVYSIERIQGLHQSAKQRLDALPFKNLRLILGDGMLGLPNLAPFDAIIVAAAGLKIPDLLYTQLSVGGRLLAPEGGAEQTLIMVERTGSAQWTRHELDPVRFVPLKSGILL